MTQIKDTRNIETTYTSNIKSNIQQLNYTETENEKCKEYFTKITLQNVYDIYKKL